MYIYYNMIYIQIVTNNWIDILSLNNNIAIRNFNNDKGSYELYDDKLIIHWDQWGKEVFSKINNIYYNCISNYIEINLENDLWNDICIFNIETSIVNRKNIKEDFGYFYFDYNKLIIKWNNSDNYEIFNQLKNGKYYINTKFGNNIKLNEKKYIKMIAIVFPQFHETPENNMFWGKGFTEWTLLKKIPRIVNDQVIKQPHSDIGYFNLNDYEHRKYMRILSDNYNIHGFCYYHYWFNNKKVLYEPLENMLLDGEPDKPFMFCWANEQWTKRWDGGNNEILLEQHYDNYEGNINHFYYLLNFFKHKNYIKKYNKPIFIFYRIEEKDIESIKNIINIWNELAIKEKFDGIHFMRFLGPFNNNINIDEICGVVEFEPGYATQKCFIDICSEDKNKIFDNYDEKLYLNKNNDIKDLVINKSISSGLEHYNNINEKEKKYRTSKFYVYDGNNLNNSILNLERLHNEQHRGICTSWNNTPRRNYTNDEYNKYPHYYTNLNPDNFSLCLKDLLNKIDNDHNDSHDFLFISAWNEWNEQAILEPNNEDGYDYLTKLSNVYLNFYNNPKNKNILNICHKGGGTEKYMNDIKQIFNQYNFYDFERFEFNINYEEIFPSIDFIHINSILFNNLKDNYLYFFFNNFKNVKKYITIHDYQWLFPDDPNIIDIYLKISKSVLVDHFKLLLTMCDKIIFPSNNIYNNYSLFIDLKYFDNKIFIVNHMDKIINYNFLVIPEIKKVINIAYVGYFVKYKGSNIFKNIILNNKNYNSNINIMYHIFGLIDNLENDINDKEKYPNVIIHNYYDDANIILDLHKNNIHGILHLSLFNESYCYALTNSINSGIPIFYINLGMFSERLCNKNKYFASNYDDIDYNYNLFLIYILKNQNNYEYYDLNNNIQPNKWYLTNYN